MKERRLNDQQGKEFHSKLINKFNKRKKNKCSNHRKNILEGDNRVVCYKKIIGKAFVLEIYVKKINLLIYLFFFKGILNYVK